MPRKPGSHGEPTRPAAGRRGAAFFAVVLALIFAALPVSGQGTGVPAADTSGSVSKADTLPTPTPQDTLGRPKSRADTVLVVQHSFNHRQQIITGSVVMSCMALMLVIMNNYNPR